MIPRKSVEKKVILLKSDKNKRDFTLRPMHIYDVALNYFYKGFGSEESS